MQASSFLLLICQTGRQQEEERQKEATRQPSQGLLARWQKPGLASRQGSQERQTRRQKAREDFQPCTVPKIIDFPRFGLLLDSAGRQANVANRHVTAKAARLQYRLQLFGHAGRLAC